MNGLSQYSSFLFVCECCGNMIRVLFDEKNDGMTCLYCGNPMKKTDMKIDDEEAYLLSLNSKEASKFQRSIFQKYIRDNEKFDEEEFKRRTIIQEREAYMRIF